MAAIRIVDTLQEEDWRRFIAQNPASNIFHTPEMFEVLSRADGHRPKLWAAVQGEHVLVLLLPTEISLARGILQRFTTRAVVYGGLLLASLPEAPTAVNELFSAYRKSTGSSLLFTELRNLRDCSALQPSLRDHGFKFEDYLNYIVDLDLPVEQVWTDVNRSTRKILKRAEAQKHLTISVMDDPDQLPDWYEVIQMSFHRKHAYLADISLFRAVFDVLHPRRMIQFLVARLGDTPIAASVALLYKDVIYGWYRGHDQRFASYRPNDQMVWHLLKWGALSGYKTFDFGGAGRPSVYYGPRGFKSKFGGRLVDYGRNTLVHSPWRLGLSRLAYRFYRRML